MRHLFLPTCPSTQTYLRELIETEGPSDQIVVSTAEQTGGHGRRGKEWVFFENSLAFSFTLKPNSVLTLTSLEIGILIIQFFKTLNLTLLQKWPNDLMNEKGEKCGGIIQQIYQDQVIVGVGINLSSNGKESVAAEIPIGSLNLKLSSDEREELPLKIVNFINQHRLQSQEIKNLFNLHHYYQNKLVTITDEEKKVSGKFIGISEFGEALLVSQPGKIEKVLTGTLRLTANS